MIIVNEREVMIMYYVLVEATDETLAMTRKVEIAEMVAMMSDEPCVIRKVER